MFRRTFLIPATSFCFLTLFACTHAPLQTSTQNFPTETAPYVTNWDERKIAALSQYKTQGTCGGLPRITSVKTAPGFCLGLVDNGDNMIFPRTAVESENKSLLVIDMGGWKKLNGRLYRLDLRNGKYQRTTLLDAGKMKSANKKVALDRPHLIARGPDGLMYIGAAGTISRFNPNSSDIESSLELVITGIPQEGLHPLKTFVFDDQGNLFVNVGSATNVCEKSGFYFEKAASCREAEETDIGQALVRKYLRNNDGSYSANYQIFSRGLRNSMGLLWHAQSRQLLQAENGRDSIGKFAKSLSDKDYPREELNVLSENHHYGWPYCYDSNKQNPEWQHVSCNNYEAPALFLPAHSAPLSMIEYKGSLFPAWYKNRVLISLHGYEGRGHRIVTFLRDEQGLPKGKALSVVYDWEARGSQTMGSPVGLSEMQDGSVLIVEDKSRKVLRLFFDGNQKGTGKPVDEIPDRIAESENEALTRERLKKKLETALRNPEPPIFAKIQEQMIDKHCASCHSGADARGMELNWYDFEGNAQRIRESGKGHEILERIQGTGSYAPMPPDGFSSLEEKNALLELYIRWLNQ